MSARERIYRQLLTIDSTMGRKGIDVFLRKFLGITSPKETNEFIKQFRTWSLIKLGAEKVEKLRNWEKSTGRGTMLQEKNKREA